MRQRCSNGRYVDHYLRQHYLDQVKGLNTSVFVSAETISTPVFFSHYSRAYLSQMSNVFLPGVTQRTHTTDIALRAARHAYGTPVQHGTVAKIVGTVQI